MLQRKKQPERFHKERAPKSNSTMFSKLSFIADLSRKGHAGTPSSNKAHIAQLQEYQEYFEDFIRE
ncbi:MAG: hypothetical protein AAGI66_04655 [Cyanobacteria bacterium P01_H01_bin.74]